MLHRHVVESISILVLVLVLVMLAVGVSSVLSGDDTSFEAIIEGS